MRPLILLCLFFMVFICRAQDFPDTIVTDKGHLFACRVMYMDEHIIYYKPEVERRETRKGRINKRDIASLALHGNATVIGWLPQRDPYLGKDHEWREVDGIIYADLHDRAPRLGHGQVTINTLLERHVRVHSRDHQIFGGAPVNMMLKLFIDESGDLKDVVIVQHASVQSVQGTITRYIEDEIMNVVTQMRPWSPATTAGVNAPSMIYLPLRFMVNSNNIMMLPTKYTYSFKGRR